MMQNNGRFSLESDNYYQTKLNNNNDCFNN